VHIVQYAVNYLMPKRYCALLLCVLISASSAVRSQLNHTGIVKNLSERTGDVPYNLHLIVQFTNLQSLHIHLSLFSVTISFSHPCLCVQWNTREILRFFDHLLQHPLLSCNSFVRGHRHYNFIVHS